MKFQTLTVETFVFVPLYETKFILLISNALFKVIYLTLSNKGKLICNKYNHILSIFSYFKVKFNITILLLVTKYQSVRTVEKSSTVNYVIIRYVEKYFRSS